LIDLEKISLGSKGRKRPVVSLPSFSMKWPSNILIGKSFSSLVGKVTRWGTQGAGNRKTRLVVLSSIVVSLFILLAGSFFPSARAKSSEPTLASKTTSQQGVIASDESVYGDLNANRSINNTSQPDQPVFTRLSPVTIEQEVVKSEKVQAQEKKPKPI